MIIDFHVHTAYYRSRTPAYMELLRQAWGDRMDWMLETYSSPQAFVGLMDESGVDFAVILAELAPITSGIAANEDVSQFCSQSPRLIPFASIDPNTSENPVDELEELVRNQGFKGLKLYPTYQQFYPNESKIYPLYAKAQELDIPVLLHIGSSIFTGSRLKYGDPLYLDDVAVDFPELKILQAHSGRPFWYQKALTLARIHKNVYMEVSGLPPQNLLTYFPELERIAHKVVYGSDWPSVATIKENIIALEGLSLSEEAKQMIMGQNAARLLKLRFNEQK
jgi:predicted TIM-barrel fold metal-dependent hydrolase